MPAHHPLPLLLPATDAAPDTAAPTDTGGGQASGFLPNRNALNTYRLKRRLQVLILVPLAILAMVNAWFDFAQSGNAVLQQDQQLLRLLPLVADSVIASGRREGAPPVLLMAPALQEFLRERNAMAGYRLSSETGVYLGGEAWIPGVVPATLESELRSDIFQGVTYRIAARRMQTVTGMMVVQLADGSGAQQQWLRALVFKVIVPNLILGLAAFFAVNWAVDRALKPLLELRRAVERRSARDTRAIPPYDTPYEVRPLVDSINRLVAAVGEQADSQRRFVADAAHQLRTPLAALQAQAEAWLPPSHGGADSVQVSREQLQRLVNATRRTTLLANQLLSLSRIDSQDQLQAGKTAVDLRAICETVLGEQLDAASAKGIDLGLEADRVLALGHSWLLQELLANLVDNAVKYVGTQTSPAAVAADPPAWSPRVTLRCGVRGGVAFLEVEDNGGGIAPAERTRVLERFYRVHGTSGVGNGLGLSIADEIARAHDASLYLEPAAAGALRHPGLRAGLLLPSV